MPHILATMPPLDERQRKIMEAIGNLGGTARKSELKRVLVDERQEMTENTLSTNLEKLEEWGYLRKKTRDDRSVFYSILNLQLSIENWIPEEFPEIPEEPPADYVVLMEVRVTNIWISDVGISRAVFINNDLDIRQGQSADRGNEEPDRLPFNQPSELREMDTGRPFQCVLQPQESITKALWAFSHTVNRNPHRTENVKGTVEVYGALGQVVGSATFEPLVALPFDSRYCK